MELMELLVEPAYRHMLLNHVPIVGLCVALLVLLTGLVVRQSALLFTGLGLVALTAGTSLPVARYGDAAYPAVYEILDGHGRNWLDYHTELAEFWLPLLYANAVVAVIALLLGILRAGILPWAALVVALFTFAGIGGAGAVAWAGGKIQHPEFRLSDPPLVGK
tara:strand:- start:9650 stop:10138 length:489 start_codon:yes stop_codon:yes gene_type:complete